MISEAYADLGGLTPSARPSRSGHAHLFDPSSGWCGCGIRDDGQIAEGSPAWRAQVELALGRPTP